MLLIFLVRYEQKLLVYLQRCFLTLTKYVDSWSYNVFCVHELETHFKHKRNSVWNSFISLIAQPLKIIITSSYIFLPRFIEWMFFKKEHDFLTFTFMSYRNSHILKTSVSKEMKKVFNKPLSMVKLEHLGKHFFVDKFVWRHNKEMVHE